MAIDKDFSAAALTWDEKPQRIHLAVAISSAIKQHITLRSDMHALEFGCGTGLVSFHLHDQLQQVTAMDNAAGMLDVLKQKAQAAGVTNVDTLHNSAAVPTLDPDSYDLIFSSMVLHHVCEIRPTLQTLVRALKPGGIIALADLDEEGGTFHDRSQGVEHHGIDRTWLHDELTRLGIHDVQETTAHTITKKRAHGDQHYSVFMLWGRKG
ncbi:MAG: class I SAM-dependent methyltransferase [Thermodesulfobacteriota bacterium]|nr:class I SAM-dependent methyltransferase [Thermodesulfobacteriota bacterium]